MLAPQEFLRFFLRWSLLVCTGIGLLDGTNLVVILVGGTTICSRFLNVL